MGLFDIIKKFVGKLVNNPIKVGIISYLIYRILKKNTNKECVMVENIKVISRKGGKELIYDDKRKQWAVVNGVNINWFTNEKHAKRNFEGVGRGIKMNEKYKEKLNNLHNVLKEDIKKSKFK